MVDEPRVQNLLDELLGSDATPEEVCKSCPELLPVVRHRWRKMRRINADLDLLFPASGDSTLPPQMGVTLPQIPGYEFEELLGRGGMGLVFRARQVALNRPVAVKIMLSGPLAGQRERERFQLEAKAVASLRHPNIVQIYDIGEVEGRPFFTMELMEGGSLAQKLAGTPQSPQDAARLLLVLTGAVQTAHASGIVHRDLKPANVLLGSEGTPKISDFGLARRFEEDPELTNTGMPMGTPSYMAPEQARGRGDAIGPAIDIYSLGAILYELLTGRPPFRAATAAETVQQVISQEAVPPSRLNSQVPRDLETICLKCLQKEPSRRYASAAALAEDLHRFERGEPIAARPAGLLERVVRRARRHPAAAGLLAALAALVLTTGIGALLLYQQQIASHFRQARTDGEVREILKRARGLLDEGWQAHDLAKLTEAGAEVHRAVDIARSGEASVAVRQEAEAFHMDAGAQLGRAAKNNALLDAVLDLWTPQKSSAIVRDEADLMLAPSSLDEQYAAQFRRWGLDVDSTAEAEVVERLRQEPEVVLQGLIAALDAWMLERWLQGRPEADWRRLFRVAEQLDSSALRRGLRAVLVRRVLPRPDTVAAVVGTGSVWSLLWELARGNAWRRLLELRQEIKPQTDPVLTVALLAPALASVGDVGGAEEVLRQAVTARPHEVELLHTLGNLLERQGRLEAAIGYYRAARSQRPQLGIALTRVLLYAGRPTEAREVMEDLVSRQPDNPSFHTFLAMAVYEQKNDAEAQTILRKSLDLNPDNAAAYYCLGIILNGQQKDDEAEAAYGKAIHLKPNFAVAYYNRGNILMKRGKYAEAALDFQKSIDFQPNLIRAINQLGLALRSQGKLFEAEKVYRKMIDLRPDYSRAYCNLGLVLHEQGKDDEAEAAGRKAIELEPNLLEAHVNLGNTLFHRKKFGEAEAAARKAIDLKPDFAMAHRNLAAALLRQQRYGEAEAALRKAVDLKADYAEAYFGLGFALSQQKKHAAAEKAYQRAIDLHYDNAQVYNDLGMALGQQWKHVAAEAAFRKAIDRQPNLLQAHVNLGTALISCRKYGEAEATLRKAIGLQSNFGPAHYWLGQALIPQARFDEAGAALKKAAELLPAQDSRRRQWLQQMQECQHWMLLDGRFPGILTGKEKPANAADQLEFAQLCFWKTYYVAAARFCQEAFAAEPKLAENAPSDIRSVAAYAAALAGCCQGKDAEHLDDKARIDWRKQAHDWLRQELTRWGKELDDGNAQTNAGVQERLRHWQGEVSLDGVRAKDALARLPDDERQQWERFWSDVDALLKKGDGK